MEKGFSMARLNNQMVGHRQSGDLNSVLNLSGESLASKNMAMSEAVPVLILYHFIYVPAD